ncbi:MAG: hypothetical protein V3W41_22060 [Planctomycetota bacterium]
MPRRPDKITVEADDGGEFDAFESISIKNDILQTAEAVLELGDDGAFAELKDIIAPGNDFTVKLNGRPRLKGRAEVNSVPVSAQGGVKLTLTVRTKMSDARYRSAAPKVKVKGATIEQFLIELFAPIGITKNDFRFAPFTAVDLMTGKASNSRLAFAPAEIKLEQAKVNPPETIYSAATRHLKRYGATIWDGPDGSIIVGAPDDTQTAHFQLLCRRPPDSQGNNIKSARKLIDWSEVVSELQVHGSTPGKEISKQSLRATLFDDDVKAIADATGHFSRLVIIRNQASKSQVQADRLAVRELSARSRRKDAWECTVDGWTYWDGHAQTPWANNTVAEVDIAPAGGAVGSYLIVSTDLTLSVGGAVETRMQLVAPGVWVI